MSIYYQHISIKWSFTLSSLFSLSTSGPNTYIWSSSPSKVCQKFAKHFLSSCPASYQPPTSHTVQDWMSTEHSDEMDWGVSASECALILMLSPNQKALNIFHITFEKNNKSKKYKTELLELYEHKQRMLCLLQAKHSLLAGGSLLSVGPCSGLQLKHGRWFSDEFWNSFTRSLKQQKELSTHGRTLYASS